MKKYGKFLMLLGLFVMLPITVKAECTDEEMAKWKSLAQNVNVSYDAVEKNGKTNFSITFSNLTRDLEIYDSDNKKMYSTSKKEYVITKTKASKTYRFDIYAKHDYCGRVSLYTIYADIPPYNKYHKDDICLGIENYSLCQKWVLIKYSYDDWKLKVKQYKDSLNIEVEDKPSSEKVESLIEKIVDIYSKIYYIIFPVIIFVGILTIYVYNKKREFF